MCEPTCGLSSIEENEILDIIGKNEFLQSSDGEKFLARFDPFILASVRQYSQDPSFVEDLYQEGVVAAFESLHTFKPEEAVRLSTHVRNAIKWRILKARRYERSRALSYGVTSNPRFQSLDACLNSDEDERSAAITEPADTHPDSCPRRVLERKSIAHAVHSALQYLTPKQQNIIDLVWLQDMRPSIAAERMGISRPRASQLLTAGLERLRAELAPAWAA